MLSEEEGSDAVESTDENVIDIDDLRSKLQEKPTVKVCKQLMGNLNVSVAKISGSDEPLKNDGSVFNEVMQLCLAEFVPALQNVLKLRTDNDGVLQNPSDSKLWKKLSTKLKHYLMDVIKVLSFVTEPASLKLIMKHVIDLIPFYVLFIKAARLLLKKMIEIWSTSVEHIRIMSFLVIVRIFKVLPEDYQPETLKQMYFAYVRNTKFTTPTSWPLINFMKRSLVEIYQLHPDTAYEHAFVYLRQLSIHLRNALTTKKKDAVQTVYNWQYVHCIIFWAQLISALYKNDSIKSLAYPLVQTAVGTITLIPTMKYVPLRLHICRTLIQLCKETNTYIGIAPLLLEVLNLTDYNKKATFSKKPMNISCALKASQSQLQETSFRDSAVTVMCELLLQYFQINCHRIGFPELILPSVIHMKNFLKKNKVAKYGQQVKNILEKIQENSDKITQLRKNVSFKISDFKAVKEWEEGLKQQGMPLSKVKREHEDKSETSLPKKRKKVS